MGIGSTNIEERTFAVSQELETTPIDFKACESVPNAGVLFLLPFLKQTGLFSYKEHYQELRKGYYFLDFIILLLAGLYVFMPDKKPGTIKTYQPR